MTQWKESGLGQVLGRVKTHLSPITPGTSSLALPATVVSAMTKTNLGRALMTGLTQKATISQQNLFQPSTLMSNSDN